MKRCPWCGDDPLYIEYHDKEWGTPVHDDRTLFEFLILEGAQAGLSWHTILRKRGNYRAAFDNFDFEKIALYTDADAARLLADAGIVRNRLKIASAIANAKSFIKIRAEFGTFDAYLRSFAGDKQIINHWESMTQIPASTPLSDAISKDLKKRGFNFIGTTIIYAFLQAVGVVDDHIADCFRAAPPKRKPASKSKPARVAES